MGGFASAFQIIDNQPLSLERFRQQNCVLLTPVQPIHEGVSPKDKRADLQPCRGSRKPRSNLCRRIAILKFIEDGLRYDDLSLYFRQNFDMSEEHQIVEGRRVCDDDHAAWSLPYSGRVSSSCLSEARSFSSSPMG
jgi:hypothetical protein